jgi:DNA polymerase III subunit epsilon
MGAKGDDMRAICSEWLTSKSAVILDTETTGLDGMAEILELAVIGTDGAPLFESLIRPAHAKEWPGAQSVHGISPEMVADMPLITEFVYELRELLTGGKVIVYNADYDRRLLSQSLRLAGHDWDVYDLQWVDVMVPYAKYWGDYSRYHGNYRWQSLTNACAQQGVTIENAHRALGDCRMTLALIQKLARS